MRTISNVAIMPSSIIWCSFLDWENIIIRSFFVASILICSLSFSICSAISKFIKNVVVVRGDFEDLVGALVVGNSTIICSFSFSMCLLMTDIKKLTSSSWKHGGNITVVRRFNVVFGCLFVDGVELVRPESFLALICSFNLFTLSVISKFMKLKSIYLVVVAVAVGWIFDGLVVAPSGTIKSPFLFKWTLIFRFSSCTRPAINEFMKRLFFS